MCTENHDCEPHNNGVVIKNQEKLLTELHEMCGSAQKYYVSKLHSMRLDGSTTKIILTKNQMIYPDVKRKKSCF